MISKAQRQVASFTDAWIETDKAGNLTVTLPVASFTDAWIETTKEIQEVIESVSHLLQMRGLKQWYYKPNNKE